MVAATQVVLGKMYSLKVKYGVICILASEKLAVELIVSYLFLRKHKNFGHSIALTLTE